MLVMEHITFDDAPLSRTVPVVPMPFGPPPTSAAASAGGPPPLFWSEEEAADLLPMHDALTCVRALERAVGNLPIARREAIGPCHSVRIPEVSLVKYVEHVVTTCDYGAVGVAIGIALLGRYSLCADQPLDGHMLHRAFLTAMQIGMKTGDFFIKNVFYAQVCGLQLAELNAQERYLLAAMQHRAIPTWSEMVALPKAILAMSEDGLTHNTINALFVQHCMLLDSSASSRVPTPGNSCLGLAPSESLTSLLLPPLVGTPSEASSSLSNGVSSEFFAPPAVTQ